MHKYLLPVMILLAITILADPPSTEDYTLTFSSFSNGGTELPDQRSSSRFLLSDIVGRGTSAAEEVLSGTSYNLYGGFRNVDLDLREPFTWVETYDWESPSSVFNIAWGGADTTIEDGYGWGLWKYDVQWSKSSDPGNWHDWHTETELTFAEFGPSDPTIVKEDTVYYFRVRGYDLVGNVYDWSEPAVGLDASGDSIKYQPSTVEYTVRQTSGDSIWTPTTAGGLVDTLEIVDGEGPVATMRSDDVFIVKNLSETDNIDIGLYSFNATPWELQDTSARDAFALRAMMNDDVTPPGEVEFYDTKNRIPLGTDNVIFAGPDTFGTGGYNIATASSDSTSRTENLWLQIHGPNMTTRYADYDDVMINIRVKARSTMY